LIVCRVRLSAFDVVRNVLDNESGYVSGVEFLYELVYVNSVESFRHVKRCDDGALWWFFHVEALCDCVVDLMECRGGGVLFLEAVLER